MGASPPRSPQDSPPLTSVEICAGAGGQAVGLHKAGFEHRALVEWDSHAVETLKANVKNWPWWDSGRAEGLKSQDVKDFLKSDQYKSLELGEEGLTLLAGGVPCPPFSLAGKRLGEDDERDLFPAMLKIVKELRPKAVMIENVRGILEPPHVFIDYRRRILAELGSLGYLVPEVDPDWPIERQEEAMNSVWRLLEARNFGVPQLRPRAILVVIRDDVPNGGDFVWPKRVKGDVASVRKILHDSMLRRCKEFWNKNEQGVRARGKQRTGRQVFNTWLELAEKAEANSTEGIAPTLVGGSRKHGGADLGPTRAKRAWAAMGVDATGVANDLENCDPERDLFRPAGPMLTVQQAAMLQGFPEDWQFQGGKTARYRQVGNAFPPPVAEAVGRAIAAVLRPEERETLLNDYVMEDAEEFAGQDSVSCQVEAFPISALTVSPRRPTGDDCSGDLVGART
ncbi:MULTISPECIES: DNA cytosine methyltransferase [Streptomyces]|uniref:DNA cytosine methyltransferase n=1 Tax=Streptomyces TaxID=1883 RepID=UPI000F78FC05|nr:DNA (cytosine-5-)-methyltransferase [Streptomyces sp. WAC05858]RSS35005.1 DNA (cytosine-5-)-methyltransferase [Streptomyces sp. WAC05858]WTA83043.1 DNA cytosine methyltransferase [Streptomyces antimycoticus]